MWIDLERLDFNGDGDEEAILKNPKAVLMFSSRGGCLLEMDDRLKAFNILDTLTRRKEGYHQKLLEGRSETPGERTRTIHEIFDSKEEDLDRYLHFDWYRRASFLDHFIADPLDFELFRRCQYHEEGNFISELYEIDAGGKEGKPEVHFSRLGNILRNGRRCPINIEKAFSIPTNQTIVEATYHIFNAGDEKVKTNFGVEFNVNLLAGDAPDRYYRIPGYPIEDRRLASLGELKGISEVRLIDEWNGMEVFLKINRECNLWRFPVETVSLSESGFERIFQGSCLLFHWPMELGPKEEFRLTVELGVQPLSK
jgi:alpha-amylase